MRAVMDGIRRVHSMPKDELMAEAKTLGAPYEVVKEVHEAGHLPVVNYAAGGVATPADAALMMQLGAEGVFVGSGIFKSDDPEQRAKAIVKAVTNYNDPEIVAEVSRGLGEPMRGLDVRSMPDEERLAVRGW
jgi:pyridoxal 5'-phosphate synthase pdxS subunit